VNVTQSGNIMARGLCLITKSEDKNKVKLSLYTSWRHKGERSGSLALLHNLCARWSWLVTFTPWMLYLTESVLCTQCVGPRTSLMPQIKPHILGHSAHNIVAVPPVVLAIIMCSAEHLNVTYISPPYVQSSHPYLGLRRILFWQWFLMFYYTPNCFGVW
jgi:hypothetical protein